ncbi:50S ribosomal protein L19e [Candidatus Woesearchaeota archaeon]|nr:50S ribosomal protein L19e [Candidatus Woesearchaeota archaeon]
MNLRSQKRIASDLMNVGSARIWFDPENLDKIKEAITKEDIRNLIKENIVIIKQLHGTARTRARKIRIQKRKKQRKGKGSRKGKANARLSNKKRWMNKIRLLRNTFKEYKIKDLINHETYKLMRKKAKGGFFRSKRHVNIFLNDNNLFLEKKK